MRVEHEEIHGALIEATKVSGRVGDAARRLAEVLHPHFVREEEIALPPRIAVGPCTWPQIAPVLKVLNDAGQRIGIARLDMPSLETRSVPA